MRKPKAEYAIQTVVNATRLLEVFQNENELGVTEIARRLGLHKNNVFRLLATLEQGGYIEQCDENERYRLGAGCLALGQSFLRSRSLPRCAPTVLNGLAGATGESVHLAVLRGFDVVHLMGQQADRAVVATLRLGDSLPAHCCALGKVLVGCSPEDVQRAYDRDVVAAGGLEARTGDTLVDGHKLFEDLRTAAVRGFALDIGECEEGLCCAAAPVFGADGAVVAAVSVSSPLSRTAESRLVGEVVPQVMAAGERISHELGYAAA